MREETRRRHIGYTFRLTARFFLYAPSHRQDSTYHWLEREIAQWVHPINDRSDDPSHHERTLLPRSYISLHYWNNNNDDNKNKNKNMYCVLCVAYVYLKVTHWLESISRERERERERERDSDFWVHTFLLLIFFLIDEYLLLFFSFFFFLWSYIYTTYIHNILIIPTGWCILTTLDYAYDQFAMQTNKK